MPLVLAVPSDVRDLLCNAQAAALPSASIVTQDIGAVSVAPATTNAAAWFAAVGDGAAFAFEDPATSDTVLTNPATGGAARLAPEPDYDPNWALLPAGYNVETNADLLPFYDPSLVVLSLALVPTNTPAGASSPSPVPEPLPGETAGLFATFHLVGEWLDAMPDFDALPVDRATNVPAIDFPLTQSCWSAADSRFRDFFAARFTGVLLVPESGDYVFALSSDDGADLWLDGAPVLTDPPRHVWRTRSASVSLTAGRHPIRIGYFDGNGTAGLRLFRHDRDGLLTSVSNSVGLVTNVYNEAAWLVSTTGADGTPVSYGYHPAGQVSSVVSVAGETDYDLDEANRVARIEAPHAAFDFGYGDWNGLVTSITNDAGLVTEFAYDLRDRLTNIVYRSPSGAEVARFGYSLDAIGRITDRTVDVIDPTNGGAGVSHAVRSTHYDYDDLDRLVSETDTDGLGVAPTIRTYSYDLAGNRLRKTDTNSGMVDYTLGLGDRLASFTGGAYEFGPAGCVTNISGGAGFSSEPPSRALAWNAQYRLVSVSTNAAFAESYTWDPLGRRATTTTTEGTIRHVYDGDQCVADLNENGAVIRSYVWGAGLDNLLAVRSGGSTYYALTDHQNTVHGFVDASGALVAHYVYDAWGNLLESSVSVPALAENRYLFQGREYSWLTGLYNFRARWYDPAAGRWLSKDPIGLSGGMNLYAFCGNDPENLSDAFGLSKAVTATSQPYTFRMYPNDIHFSGKHIHVYEKGVLCGRISLDGNIIKTEPGRRITNTALKRFGKVQGVFMRHAAEASVNAGAAKLSVPATASSLGVGFSAIIGLCIDPPSLAGATIDDAIAMGLYTPTPVEGDDNDEK